MLEFIYSMAKKSIYKYIILYSLIFIAIRLLASTVGMTYDEAEQFIDAQNYVLGYLDQPPLYSWIIKTCSLVFGLNVPMMVCVYHTVTIIFLIYLYKILDFLFTDDKKIFFAFISYVLFFIYSYDFYRYTIHTALMAMFCAIAFYIYLKIFKGEDKLSNYLLLGLSFGLGLLSKYNFIFFVLALIIPSLFSKKSRAILFDTKTIFAIAVCVLTFLPHALWLINNDFETLNYALQRGEAGASEKDFSLIKVLLNTYWNYLVYCGVIIVFFFKDLSWKDDEEAKLFKSMLIFAIVFPFLLILILEAGNFTQRWLAPLNLLFPIIVFYFIEIKDITLKHKIFKYGIYVLIIVFYLMRICSYYFPDQFKPSFLSKPYEAIYRNLEKDFLNFGFDIAKNKIYSFREVGILAGVKTFYKDQKIEVLRNTDDLNENMALVIWSEEKENNFDNFCNRNQVNCSKVFSKSAPFLFSRKGRMYKVNFGTVQKIY